MLQVAIVLALAAGCGGNGVDRGPVGRVALDASVNFPKIETTDHQVPHVSTVPANAGETVYLSVRQLRAVNREPGKPVLMIHGASSPAAVGADLRLDHYSWALWLAQSGGFDVFILDFQGSGKSHRPAPMNDPCNVPLADQARLLVPYQLASTCAPSYAFELVTSRSDWDELDTAVDFVRALRKVEKVSLTSWSQGSFRVGPYSVMHPEKVERLLLLAAIYRKDFPLSGAGPDGFGSPVPLPRVGIGTPMTVRTKADNFAPWNAESRCEGQVEDGIQDRIWEATMDDDPVGRTWGPTPAGASAPEGILRVRSPTLWGWNARMAARVTVPVLIIQGQFDRGAGGFQHLADLYDTVQSAQKLRFRVECAGHYMPWEKQRRILHHVSKEWIAHGSVAGFETGEFFVDTEGKLSRCVRSADDPVRCDVE